MAGSVWAAENLLVGRRVAIKILNDSVTQIEGMQQRFHAEARLSAKLAHPNVVDVYDLGNTEQGVPYIVMEVLDGETLETVLERRRRLPTSEACDLMLQVLSTLDAAHDLDIVHRDLKPANIMLIYPKRGQCKVKVLDFGIAQGLRTDGPSEAGMVIGTPEYMAPEQALGSRVDPRCDLYAAGVILYELLSGQRPIVGNSLEAVLTNVMTVEPRPLKELVRVVPPMLETLIMNALAKDPDRRPRTAAEMIDVLARFGEARPSVMPSRSEPAMPLLKRRPYPPSPPAEKQKQRQKLELVPESTLPPPDIDDDWE